MPGVAGATGPVARPPTAAFPDVSHGTVDTATITPITVGFAFRVNVPGQIVGIRAYRSPGAATGQLTAGLWDTATPATPLATAGPITPVDGWNNIMFTTPVRVVPGVSYTAGTLYETGQYSYVNQYFTEERVSGPFILPLPNGRFVEAATLTMPSRTYTSRANYNVDAIFDYNVSMFESAPPIMSTTTASDGPVNVGTGFRVTVPGQIVALQQYLSLKTGIDAIDMCLWEYDLPVTDQSVAKLLVKVRKANDQLQIGLNDFSLTKAIPVIPTGKEYVVSAFYPQATWNIGESVFGDADVTADPFIIRANNGRFKYATVASCPDGLSLGKVNYGQDVVFEWSKP